MVLKIMKHLKSKHKGNPKIPGYPEKERERLLVKMCRALITLERIEGTHVRAKNCQRWTEQCISASKRYKDPYLNPYERRRAKNLVLKHLGLEGDPDFQEHPSWICMTEKLHDRYALRAGGATRMIRSRKRIRDDIQMVWLELTDRDGEFRKPRLPMPVKMYLQEKQVAEFLALRKREKAKLENPHSVNLEKQIEDSPQSKTDNRRREPRQVRSQWLPSGPGKEAETSI